MLRGMTNIVLVSNLWRFDEDPIDYSLTKFFIQSRYYLPTPPLGQDTTQGQFLSGV